MTIPTESRDIRSVTIESEMKRSYLDYAMSVIVSRALPDVRDGLKPVHRRILYSMKDSGNEYNRPYRKSARTVGDVMGKYHPHGDMAIYDALVRLAQDFSLRVPLVDGQGNFGSMDGDPPAASRYTEARLSKAAHILLEDIEKETVDFQPNYDESTTEPKVLPARFPNILVNGGSGIAVGMATNIPTHNLGELIDACCALIDDPELSIEQLMQYVPGPDFPTGGMIMGRAGILSAYRTGRGSIVIRGKTHIEKLRGDREAIIITEVPFQVNKARMIERIAEAAKEKIIEGISDLRDESDRDGMRVVIELKREAISDVVLNQLYRHSSLQSSFGINMLAIHQGRPEQLNLKDILVAFLEFREEVIVRRTRYTLLKARERAHLMIGLGIAVANIDKVITLIKTAPDQQTAKERLMAEYWPAKDMDSLILLVDDPTHPLEDDGTYRLTESQAKGILDLRLHRLTGLEREKIADELKVLHAQIEDLLDILASRPRLMQIMRSELEEVKSDYPSPRLTTIEEGDSTVDMEDLIQREDMVVTVSHEGYIKRVPLSTYRAQRRGGKGRSGMATREEDIVSDVFVANTHSPVLFFSSTGKVYQLKVYRLPLGSPQSKGRPMINLLPLEKGEVISTVMVLPDDAHECENMHIMFATSQGNVRRNMLSDFLNIKSNGKIAMKLEDDEKLISVKTCTENDDVMMATAQGKAIRFPVTKIRVFAGRASNGVRGIRLNEGDEAISMTILKHCDATAEEKVAYLRQASKVRQILQELQNDEVEEGNFDPEDQNSEELIVSNVPDLLPERFRQLAEQEQFILTVTENGYGKRTSSFEYRVTGRGGQGVKNIVVNKRNGGVVGSFPLEPNDQIMLVTDSGKIIRCPIDEIRIAGRNTQGVIIFRIEGTEKVVAVSRISIDEEENQASLEGDSIDTAEVLNESDEPSTD